MKTSGLLKFRDNLRQYNELIAALSRKQNNRLNVHVVEAARSYLIACLAESLRIPILVICAQPERAVRLYDELQIWCSELTQTFFYPEHEFLAGEFVYDENATAQRLQTLSVLAGSESHGKEACIPVVICSGAAAASATIAKDDFTDRCQKVTAGMSIDPLKLVSGLQEMGYEMEGMVEVPGTMARRGGIVDIYSPDQDKPVRIEFFGMEVDSIRYFDPASQRSLQTTETVTIVPAKENVDLTKKGTILEHISPEVLVITDSADELEEVIGRINDQYNEYVAEERGGSRSAALNSYLDWHDFSSKIESLEKWLCFSRSTFENNDSAMIVMPFTVPEDYCGRLKAFLTAMDELQGSQNIVTIVSQQTGRLKELLTEESIPVRVVENMVHLPPAGTITLIHGSLHGGWSLDKNLTVLTDREIFGFIKQRRLSRKRPAKRYKYVSEIEEGDYVVHIDHGISKFKGLNKMEIEGVEREFITLEYAAGDRLFVPVEQIDRVGHYIGGTDQPPRLSRLHTQEWNNAKQRVKRSVVEIAEELVKLYASRELIKGFAFRGDNIWQQELESSFPYVETPDQMKAVIAVKEDMENTRPMDRLVCGDVGYGKTEVALRAAFKAVMDGKQVAILVPTTVLAQQHYYTFCERLQAFPVRVEVLSRLATDKEQKSILEDVSEGAVDICIGTHRLLQKDVIFKDLGLLVIDEEQRFGVAHKDYFKKLRNEIDVLTLSATPIPRTLNMALTGIRDMSTMDTPPEERLPIKTHVGYYDKVLVREAILRELERNGQVFFVHNRVHNILVVAAELRELVPEARISVAHGQMPDELERVMSDFVQRKSDILLTTTIIESGLDMPNVNTLIVNDADKLGLTQLYQLRGRIGRGANTAYAYFFFSRGGKLTGQARKRLATVAETTELGAGFKIAMKDLEIRGAGNLLGVDQSGNISIVGFDLYCSLLAEAVDELRTSAGGEKKRSLSTTARPSVNLPVDAFIPDTYISDVNIRLSYYRRLANANELLTVENLREEMKDRFGDVPEETEALLYTVKIRLKAAMAGVEQIISRDSTVVLYFSNVLSPLSAAEKGLSLSVGRGITIGRKQVRFDLAQLGRSWRGVLEDLLDFYGDGSIE